MLQRARHGWPAPAPAGASPRIILLPAVLGALLALLALLVLTATAAAAPAGGTATPFRPGFVLVGFHSGVSAARQDSIVSAAGGHGQRGLGSGVHLVNVPAGQELATLNRLGRVGQGALRFAEPDYLMREDATPPVFPNDPSFGLQWAFHNTGQSVNGTSGTPGADENAGPAWSLTTGTPQVVIGETDSGVDYTHPDLAGNIWSNPGNIGGCPAGTHGYNVVAATCDPMDDEVPYGGHGTHVAGILGASGNNGVGVTGVNWSTTILPVKWLNSSGSGYTDQLISALNWLVQAKQAGVNVRVVNDSATFVGTAYSQALSDMIDTLGQNDILFVTAAGNTGDDNDNLSLRRYPCGYDRPTEICVTASDQFDKKPSWANYGATTVDLAAPGANIYSTLRGGTYGYISGGSMASPQVAGTAALALSRGYLSVTALRADILDNVDPLPAWQGVVRTGGRLDVCRAVPGCASASSSVPQSSSPPVITGGTQVGQTLTASTGVWTGNPTGYTYQWRSCDGTGGACSDISGQTTSSYTLAAGDAGSTIRVVVTATNSAGSASATSAQTAVITAAGGGGSGGTFGTTTIGRSSDTMLANRKRVNAYTISTAASITKLTMYLQPTGTSGQQVLRGVIYADNAGAPGALLGTTNEITFSSTQTAGWYDMPLPAAVNVAAGKYWIGMISGPNNNVAGFRYDSVTASRRYNANTYTSGPTNPFGTATTDSEQTSLYATYTTGP